MCALALLKSTMPNYMANRRGANVNNPCKSDPDLCMQLDARDAETSVPAILNGEHSVLFRNHYDPKSDARSCVLPDSKEPVAGRVICLPFLISPALTSPTLSCKVVNIEDVMFALVLFVCYGWRMRGYCRGHLRYRAAVSLFDGRSTDSPWRLFSGRGFYRRLLATCAAI